jgi:hypothetical protein
VGEFAATLHHHRATTLVTPSCWGWQPWLTWALDGPSIIGAHDPFHHGRLNHSAFTYRLRVADDATERRSRRALGFARLSCGCSPNGHGDRVRQTKWLRFWWPRSARRQCVCRDLDARNPPVRVCGP